MAYSAKVLCDSLSPDGVRLTTLEVTLPRIVLAEFNTHRAFSRNSASSRAIPVEKMLQKVQEDPFVPIHWGKNQKGMQAEAEFSAQEAEGLRLQWLQARDQAVFAAQSLLQTGVHKQVTNRLLEPWLWHTIIVTATEWNNFWGLRCSKDAQPEIRRAAELMKRVYDDSCPRHLTHGQWHLPLVQDWELEPFDDPSDLLYADIVDVSVGRCARVSYLTHDGRRDPKADLELSRDRLLPAGHMSPFEHVARPMTQADMERLLRELAPVSVDVLDLDVSRMFCGNFRGWVQRRKELPNEADFSSRKRGT